MISFLLRWVIVSILVSILSAWFGIVPAYPKRRYTFFVHAVDTAVLTLVLTILLIRGIYPHWIIILMLILVSLAGSVWLVNRMIPEDDLHRIRNNGAK